jgi:Na+/H+ antiporter NhaC
MGTHLSLISDNPIMASASTGANHFELVKSMSWYIAPIAISSAVAYAALGLCISSYGLTKSLLLSLIIGIVCAIFFIEAAQKLFGLRSTAK